MGDFSPAVARAAKIAEEAHRLQRRTDGQPYIGHPLEVAGELGRIGAEERLVIAAVLHDVVEKSAVSISTVETEFGPAVAGVVAALTEDPSISDWVDRKLALREQVEHSGCDAATVYAADRLVNVREIRRVYRVVGEDVIDLRHAPTIDAKVEAWLRDVEAVTRCRVVSELSSALLTEIAMLEADRRAHTDSARA